MSRYYRTNVASRVLAAFSCVWMSGCTIGSLATSTGPKPDGATWSVAARQQVHVGERVHFDFVLQNWMGRRIDPRGVADYVVVSIGETKLQAATDLGGHFTFDHRFLGVQPGDSVAVSATAYYRNGAVDFVPVRNRWERVDSAYDVPDRRIASDVITLVAYESPIHLTLVRPADDLDPSTGTLSIRRCAGETTTVYRNTPTRGGFLLSDPGPDGLYRISYTPSGDEICPTGTTEVEFTIHDLAGQVHTVSGTIDTP